MSDPQVPGRRSLCGNYPLDARQAPLARYGIQVIRVNRHSPIPGSFLGEPEAGIIGNRVCVRDDTPLHSMLHEACHYICLDAARRYGLHTAAGENDAEENAVCLLQILLADHLPLYDRRRMMQDMDTWGYSFRLGSAAAWFHHDADDACRWLLARGLIDERHQPTWRVNEETRPTE